MPDPRTERGYADMRRPAIPPAKQRASGWNAEVSTGTRAHRSFWGIHHATGHSACCLPPMKVTEVLPQVQACQMWMKRLIGLFPFGLPSR